jgi:hypothetical protein
MPIRTRGGAAEPDSPWAARPWVYGADDFNVYRNFSDGSMVISSEPKMTEVNEEFQFSYVGT